MLGLTPTLVCQRNSPLYALTCTMLNRQAPGPQAGVSDAAALRGGR